MRYAPHDYQAYAIDYIETHPIATVFLDMGLGKTSITLTAISNLLFDRADNLTLFCGYRPCYYSVLERICDYQI